ncbi:MAG: hypothetical protein LVQ64_04650 [Thermoplasmatales archaeon]|nr:hypothetical protein [Thermoplasmatales archaeon]
MALRGSPPIDELALWGEYPFLPGADRLTEDLSVSVRDLVTEPRYDQVRSIGRARALAGADDPRGTAALEELANARPLERYLSFLFARLLLASTPTPGALRRWAVAEAKRAYDRLSSASADFRLAAQPLAHGRIALARARAARLLEEAVRIELARPRPMAAEVEALVRSRESVAIEELARRVPVPRARPTAGPAALRPELFPPCIRKMRRTLEAGENLSHSGRFALAAFLHRVGADEETIVDAYRGAPDFEEAITRYQVEHITHHEGGRGYEPPECATLRSHGLCVREGDPAAAAPADRARDPICFEPTLRHPLQYYRIRGGPVVEAPERG